MGSTYSNGNVLSQVNLSQKFRTYLRSQTTSERFGEKLVLLESAFPLLFPYFVMFSPSTIKRFKISTIINRAFSSRLPEVIISFSTSSIVLSMRLLSSPHFTPQHLSLSLSPCSDLSTTFPSLPSSFFPTNTFSSFVVFQHRTNTHHTYPLRHTIITKMSATMNSPNDTVADAAVENNQIGHAEPSASAATDSHDLPLASGGYESDTEPDLNSTAGSKQRANANGHGQVSHIIHCQEIAGSHKSLGTPVRCTYRALPAVTSSVAWIVV